MYTPPTPNVPGLRRSSRTVNDTIRALLPLLLLAGAFAVLVMLPARARSRMAQQTRQMQDSLRVGTEVMTTSGVYGRITALREDTVNLEIAPGVVVEWARAAIGQVRHPERFGEPHPDQPREGPAEPVGE
jgi:preprotein translocase subunit YajC